MEARPFFSLLAFSACHVLISRLGFVIWLPVTTAYLPLATWTPRLGRSGPSFQSSVAWRRAVFLFRVISWRVYFSIWARSFLTSHRSCIFSRCARRCFSCQMMAPLTWRISLAFFAWRAALRPGRASNWGIFAFRFQAAVGVVVVVVVVGDADYRAIDGRAGSWAGCDGERSRAEESAPVLDTAGGVGGGARWTVGGQLGGRSAGAASRWRCTSTSKSKRPKTFVARVPIAAPTPTGHPRQPGRWQKCPCGPSPKH